MHIKCYNCNEYGHKSPQCPQPRRNGAGKGKGKGRGPQQQAAQVLDLSMSAYGPPVEAYSTFGREVFENIFALADPADREVPAPASSLQQMQVAEPSASPQRHAVPVGSKRALDGDAVTPALQLNK
jgi:hypothetical protein